eukprot:GFYU01009760.1.p1 GENE.GFYU01009760.1~~GFYU01009760.1.p1  ORF type:complete len:293 (+),score=47.92 GFYU01009760.1:196-1074(+)
MPVAFVAGATGATGRHVVTQLLDADCQVRIVVRDVNKIPDSIAQHPKYDTNAKVVEGSILDLPTDQVHQLVSGCDIIIQCLGHRDVFAPPRYLCRDAAQLLCEAAKETNAVRSRDSGKVRFILMNTVLAKDKEAEPYKWLEGAFISLLRRFIPPHADNEAAAEYLRNDVGANDPVVEWLVVRPGALVDAEAATETTYVASPPLDVIANWISTTRVDCAKFMTDTALSQPSSWARVAGGSPCVYDKASFVKATAPRGPWYRRPSPATMVCATVVTVTTGVVLARRGVLKLPWM